jgi:glutamate dehydrogenase
VEALDNKVSTDTQHLLMLECRRLMDRSSRWLLQNRRLPLDIGAEIARFRPTVVELAPRVPDLLVDGYAERMRGQARRFVEAGVPADTALRAAELLDLFSTLDITEVALRRDLPVTEVAEVYYQLSWRYRVDDLLEQITALPRDDRWHALARSALRYDTYTTLAELTGEVLDSTPRGEAAAERVAAWERANAAAFERVQNSLGELVRQHDSDLATLSVVLRQFRTLVRASASR